MLKVLISKWQYTQNTEVIYAFSFKANCIITKFVLLGLLLALTFGPG